MFYDHGEAVFGNKNILTKNNINCIIVSVLSHHHFYTLPDLTKVSLVFFFFFFLILEGRANKHCY